MIFQGKETWGVIYDLILQLDPSSSLKCLKQTALVGKQCVSRKQPPTSCWFSIGHHSAVRRLGSQQS